MNQKSESWLGEINSIRQHFLAWLKSFLALVFCIYPFNQELYSQLAKPLMLNKPHVIIATSVAAPFTAPLKLALFVAFCLSMPILLWQLWQYIKPAMQKNERVIVAWLLSVGVILYTLGTVFCFAWVIPSTVAVFQKLTPANVTYMPDMNSYLDFALSLAIAFGLCFEIPVVIITLVYIGLLDIVSLEHRRKEIIVLCFVLAMLLTPPDVTSQILLALPMWALYEISIILCRFLCQKQLRLD